MTVGSTQHSGPGQDKTCQSGGTGAAAAAAAPRAHQWEDFHVSLEQHGPNSVAWYTMPGVAYSHSVAVMWILLVR